VCVCFGVKIGQIFKPKEFTGTKKKKKKKYWSNKDELFLLG